MVELGREINLIDEVSGCPFEVVYEVCVFDLDRPWEEFRVTTVSVPVAYMRWDPSGSHLLIVDAGGTFTVWIMKDYLINTWEEYGSTALPGEEVLILAWLHNGIQVLFNPEKHDQVAYNDKFQRSKFNPTVTHFGNKPLDGWMAVTATGLVTVGLLQEPGQKLIMGKQCLAPGYLRLTQADIAFMASGEVMVAASDGTVGSAIQCFIISVKLENNACKITTHPGASFFLKSTAEYSNRDLHLHVSKICFLNRENSDILLVCCAGPNHSSVEVWHLLEQTMPLNRIFQSVANPELACKTPKWMHKASIVHNAHLTDIARPKLPMNRTYNIETTAFVAYFACTYRDGVIKIIHRQSYQVIHTSSMETLGGPVSSVPGDHLLTSSPHLMSCVQTSTGCGLVGQSQGSLCVFRVFNSRDGCLQLLPGFLVLLLEYTMFVGHDIWDVLLAVRQGMVEGLAQQIIDNFQKQTPSFQELIRMRLLRLRMALCSIVPSGRQRAAECRALLTLFSISTVLRSIFRPKAVSVQEKTPAEKLTAHCSISTETDIDALIKNLDPEEFIVESVKKEKGSQASLQMLQPFIQWVADFVLHLLSSVPLIQNGHNMPGMGLLRDVSVLVMLRDLLAIMRLWGSINPACLPTFSTTSFHDCLGHIFKLLTRVWQIRKEGASMELEEGLVDECASLPSKVLIPDFHFSYGRDSCSFAVFTQPPPLRFSFGKEPDYLYAIRKTFHVYPAETAPDTKQCHDIVRHIHLGITPCEPVRECIRCGAFSLLRTMARSTLLESWEKRFIRNCVCGARWKLSNSDFKHVAKKRTK
ncbi:hypothetical protein C0Q70_05652 [Pomacea canaliculata]|uniref:Mediator of RNA polymerase II transcription subunit 16 n=1 Tax=Pomacea canaliculata TaxID=400727 RepID=A0A2T7PLT8_POMCA|nr:hypothetical protein C0Q70_05652 [Pomacea canaliculata]